MEFLRSGIFLKKYIISICKEGNGCPDKGQIELDNSLQYLEYSSTVPLEQCSNYSLHIKPIFTGVNLQEKVLYFQTLYPPMEFVTNLKNAIEAEAIDEHMITVKWKPIQCANHYKVHQRVSSDGDWERIGITKNNYFQNRGVPCVEYKYKVKAAVGNQETELIEMDDPIRIKSDLPADYVILNLDIRETTDGAKLPNKILYLCGS